MELILKAKDIRVEFKGRDVLDININSITFPPVYNRMFSFACTQGKPCDFSRKNYMKIKYINMVPPMNFVLNLIF